MRLSRLRVVATLMLAALVAAGVWGAFTLPAASALVVRAQGATRRVPEIFPRADYVALAGQRHAVGPDFSGYYNAHQGATLLGPAITAEIPVSGGLEQIYVNGELRRDAGGTVTPLAIVPQLIGAGAEVPLAAPASTLTYRALWPDLASGALVSPPWWWQSGGDPSAVGLFVREGAASNGAPLGHYIPAFFASFLTGLGDWQALVGAPLVEARLGTAWVNGAAHQIVAQPFERAMLWIDRDAAGTPQVESQPIGADLVSVFGPPSLDGSDGRQAWASGAATVLPGPGAGAAVATLFDGFPMTLTGDSVWLSGALWYHVQWKNLASERDGWVAADQLAFDQPDGGGTTTADLGALSPQLGAYASQQDAHIAVAVYVPDLNRYYVYNPDVAIATASTIKVPMLIALLQLAESQGRALTSDEQDLAQAMIEDSDNDAATEIYGEINYNVGVDDVMAEANAPGLTVNTQAFGFSTTTPLAMAQLLTALDQGKLLSAADTAYALNLMSSVIPAQQEGVAATAPPGATWAMKDGFGWVDTGDGWVTDSVGIVTPKGGHTYVVAVLGRLYDSLDDGWQVVNTICAEIASSLAG